MYISVNSSTGVKTMVWEIQSGWSSLYSVSLVDADRRCKILKNGNNYSFYYHNGTAWVQLWVTTANTFSWNPYVHYFGASTYNRSNAYIDNPSVSNVDITWLYAISNSTIRTYISWTGIQSTVLSKTDADFTYKLPDIPRLATKAYNAGELVKYDFAGISKSLSGLTEWAGYFVSNTPWQLGTSAGTNVCQIGRWKSWNILLWPDVFDWISLTNNTVYYASRNGIVTWTVSWNSGNWTITWYADYVNWSTTARASGGSSYANNIDSISFPVIKWQYFKISFSGSNWHTWYWFYYQS
jgi:hypothetical protein